MTANNPPVPRTIDDFKNALGLAILQANFKAIGQEVPAYVMEQAPRRHNHDAADLWLGSQPEGVRELGWVAARALEAAGHGHQAVVESFLSDMCKCREMMSLVRWSPDNYLGELLPTAMCDPELFKVLLKIFRDLTQADAERE